MCILVTSSFHLPISSASRGSLNGDSQRNFPFGAIIAFSSHATHCSMKYSEKSFLKIGGLSEAESRTADLRIEWLETPALTNSATGSADLKFLYLEVASRRIIYRGTINHIPSTAQDIHFLYIYAHSPFFV